MAQNNGKDAHQEVPHVHYHIIPKRGGYQGKGLHMEWQPDTSSKDMDKLKTLHAKLSEAIKGTKL